MPFTVPNSVAATYPEQAQLDKGDFDALAAGANLTGTVTGCGVTVVSGLTVRLAAGTVRIGGRPVTVAQQDFALTADATQKKFYLITITTSGTGAAEAGSAAASPTFPDVPGAYAFPPTKAIQAAVEIPGGAVSLTTAGNIVDKRVPVPSDNGYLRPEWFGAVGDANQTGGGTDDTAAIAAMNTYAATLSVVPSLVFRAGAFYRVTGLLTFPTHARITSDGANPLMYPRLIWSGVAGGTVATRTFLGSPSASYGVWEKVNIQGRNDGADLPAICLDLPDRCDRFGGVRDASFTFFNGAGVRFRRGGINTVIQRITTDECKGASIYWDVILSDNVVIKDCTFDNALEVADGGPGGAVAIKFDASLAPNTSKVVFTLDTINIELQDPLTNPTTEGAITLVNNPANSTRVNFLGHLRHVYVNGTNSDDYAALRVTPASDDLVLTIEDCLFPGGIAGIPNAVNLAIDAGVSQAGHIPFLTIAPRTAKINDGPSGVETAFPFVGSPNFVLGPVLQNGQEARIAYGVLPASLPAGTTVYRGTEFYDAAALTGSTTSMVRVIAGTDGTVGTLSGVTATTTAGNASVTVTSTTDLRKGQYIAIAGVSGSYKILHINPLTNVIVVTGSPNASVSGAAVSFAAPTYRQQAVTLAAYP